MCGAACVVATCRAIASLKLPVNVRGLIPLCEHMIGANTVRSGDVVTAKNGLSVEVQHTDQEAPLVLVDALLYAENFNPKYILDVGTLHNDMKGALGEAASAVFTSNEGMWQELASAAVHTGDRVWRMPIWNYYTGLVKNSCSVDIQNVGQGRGGGSCKAAAILREFVPPNVEWMHVVRVKEFNFLSSVGSFSQFRFKDAMGVMTTNGNPFPYLKNGMSGRPTRTIIEYLAKGIKLDGTPEKKCNKF